MATGSTGPLDRIRQPAYTGENRCIPCTAVNAVIAIALAGLVGLLAFVLELGPALAGGAAAIVLVVSGLSIWLRGYLVPGTPTLTKRYFPDWLLAKFEKAPPGTSPEEMAPLHEGDDEHGPDPIQDRNVGLNPHQVLAEAQLIQECETEDDLCLVAGVREAWEEEMAAVRETDLQEAVAEFLEVDPDRVTMHVHDDVVYVRVGGVRTARWESESALIADLGGDRLLRRRVVGWDDMDVAQRAHVAGGLRAFVERCPTCEAPVELGEDVVESCCRSRDVYAITCEGCEDRILEVPQAG